MAALFSKPKTPDPVLPNPLPPPPDRSSDETAALAAEQRQKAAKGGRAFTMLTGGQGAGTGAVASRYLGAAART
jgi:hypothetical protein